MKYTAGPWKVGGVIGFSKGLRTIPIEGVNEEVIADVEFLSDLRGSRGDAEANARLIAAAPDLLKAAIAVLKKESEMTTGAAYLEYRALEAAIAKATE